MTLARTADCYPPICDIAITGNSITIRWAADTPEITRDRYWRDWISGLYHMRMGKWIDRPEGDTIELDTYRPIDPKRST